MFTYLFFDLDGTLTDSADGIINSVLYTLKKWGIDETDREKLRKFVGPPLKDSFAKYYGFKPEEMDRMLSVYREYFEERGMFENSVYPGIPELLAKLKAQGKKIVLATSKPEKYSIIILKHFGLYEYFDYFSGATMDEKRVEKADIIEYGIETIGIADRSQVLMIGDREHDIIGAKKAGVKSCGVLYGFGDLEELLAAGADFIVDTPEDIGKIV